MLTPLDIENIVFSRKLTGYDPREVDEFLDRVVASYEAQYRENLILKEKVDALTDRVAEFEKLQETMQESIRAAERAAGEARDQARARAALIVEEAESEARQIQAAALARVEEAERKFDFLRRQEHVFRLRIRELLRVLEGVVAESTAAPEAAATAEGITEDMIEE